MNIILCFLRRGPNKYTRNWEDEDAYGKVAGSTPNKSAGRKSNRSSEEFPALDDSNKVGPIFLFN